MTECKVGDVVRLKSGGPAMTVEEGPNEDGKVLCMWFEKNGKTAAALFLPSMLKEGEDDGTVFAV